MSPDEVERRMRPGGWFTRPMLGKEQSLERILAEDEQKLRTLTSTAAQLGEGLAELLTAAARSDWLRPFRVRKFHVELDRRRGLVTCPLAAEEFAPWTHGGGNRPTANEFVVRNLTSNVQLAGYELSVHLIRDHGFFGGAGTAFRIEPSDLAAVLGR